MCHVNDAPAIPLPQTVPHNQITAQHEKNELHIYSGQSQIPRTVNCDGNNRKTERKGELTKQGSIKH